MPYLCVAAGGGAGALLRFIASRAAASVKPDFALGTLIVNCAGAFLIGFLINAFDSFARRENFKLLVITGFLGGLTTFSAYSLETARYFSNGNLLYAAANIVLNNVLGVTFVFAGLAAYRAISG